MRLPRSSASVLASRVALGCLGPGLFLACHATDPGRRAPRGDSVRQELIAEPEIYTGADLGAKELVLTFDDGPATVTAELSTWLKNRPAPIRATFFVNGACIAATSLPNNSCAVPVAGAAAVLAQITNDGHLVANHTTTHRDITSVPAGERAQELSETDQLIAAYIPIHRFLFRAPFGAWDAAVHATVAATAMNKYVGPIYWTVGGGPTGASKAADWECWELGYTTRQCGDLYLTETRAVGRGLVLMHDPYGTASNHDLDNGIGNTVDMVKYIVPILEAEGYSFKAIYDVPAILAALPPPPTCNPSCATCSGPAASQCLSCAAGAYLAAGTCTACSACGAGKFTSTACSTTADTVCGSCQPSCTACAGPAVEQCGSCPPAHYLAGGVCSACTTCAAGTVQISACSASQNTACSSCVDDCRDSDPCTKDECTPTGCVHTPGHCPPLSSSASSSGGNDAGPPVLPPAEGESDGCSASGSTAPRAASSVLLGALALALVRRRRRRGLRQT